VSGRKSLWAELVKGLWSESPTFRLLLGICPTLAVTNSARGGLSMGLATSFVLISSSTIVSLIKRAVPTQVRIATYVAVIATFVTVADYVLKARFWDISKELGPYVPLIVVNCIILHRQESFSSKHAVHFAVVDAVGMGLGFTWALTLLGVIRELLGAGTVFGARVMPAAYEPWVVMILPAGAFLTLGVLLGIMNHIQSGKGAR